MVSDNSSYLEFCSVTIVVLEKLDNSRRLELRQLTFTYICGT